MDAYICQLFQHILHVALLNDIDQSHAGFIDFILHTAHGISYMSYIWVKYMIICPLVR